ncbi:MAG TPA: VOC family protein [Candidatus Acidoferrum sp.]|nr:VOC family protein [Candidatus Acidoferrum sp.]
MRRRTFISVTIGAAAAFTFPRVAQPEAQGRENSVEPNLEDHRTGDQPMPHPVVHFEIGCKDIAKTQEFYKKLFDWKIDAMGPAAMIASEAGGIPGHITALGHEPQHYTIFYVGVDDVAAYLEKAKALGAKTLVPPVDIPTGTFAWMQDPEGNMVGLWKNKS